ncbi:DEAD/DEAH box helicase [Streptomyces sp. NPDC056656]|uniref:DEAD/DEAH box helicase n=1 Tax=Streptomyces sp. NPDC056656 TaxID=3345895 RepID=UPI00368F9F2B
MPLDNASGPPQPCDDAHESMGRPPWDLSKKDWEVLRNVLCALYRTDGERRHFAIELGYPAHELPDASTPLDFWERIKTFAEMGVVDWGFREIVQAFSKRIPFNHEVRLLAAKYQVHIGAAVPAADGDGPPPATEPVGVAPTAVLPPGAAVEPVPAAGPVPTVPAQSASGSAQRPAGVVHGASGYADILPRSLQPDQRKAFLSLWEEKLGPWEALDGFQRELIQVCRKIIDDRGVALVYAVTNSGKTTVARAGMTMALNSDNSAMMLLPTKALVAQEEAEWQNWLGSREPLNRLQVYGVSRDHPESDRPVGGGRYSVAVAIYEKLGVYLVNGLSPLENTGLVVVDELQMLSETSDRAAKLEALLTLIKLRAGEDQPSLLGLSAALTPEAGKTLERWLGDGRTTFTPTSNARPVPLDAFVVDSKAWLIQRDAHLLSMPSDAMAESEPALPEAEVKEPHALPELRKKYAQALSTGLDGLQGVLSTAELAVTLVLSILGQDDTRRIIVFVPTRTAAKKLAEGIRKVLDQATGRHPRNSPWTHGRYRGKSSAARDQAGKLYSRLLKSDIPDHDLVIRGLRSGVAFHTAALAPSMRRTLEDEFRAEDGLLRVLVATDTLAVGLNLPADTVIATSITGLTGAGSDGSRQILLPADLDNKGGRAGRRGKTTAERGQFYILVPSDRELQLIGDLTAPEIDELSSAEGVFKRFVKSRSRSLMVRSQYRDLVAISGLVLQVLCQDNRIRPREQWLARVAVILDNLLISYEPDHPQLPTPEQVLAELEGRELIQEENISARPGAGKSLTLSPVGHAVGRSGLELDDAPELQRLAERACGGAGTIDLLWHACRARSIRQVTAWVSLPGKGTSRHMPSLKGAVQSMALAHCSEYEQQRDDCVAWVAAEGVAMPDRLLSAHNVVVSAELRSLLETDEESAPTDEANALLRALVAYEWMNGVPFAEMQQRFSRAIRSEEAPDKGSMNSPSVSLYYSDIEQLCEQMAGYLRAAAEISVTDDGIDHSGRMQLMAQQVESGLPAWLAKVSKMRIVGLHRERLAKLADLPEESQPSPLSGLVDTEPLREGLTDDERDDARRVIDNRVEQDREHRERLTREWASVVIPAGEGSNFDDVSTELEEADGPAQYLQSLCWLAGCLGMEATEPEQKGSYVVSQWSADGTEPITVRVPVTELTGEMVLGVAQEHTLVVVRDRRPGAHGVLGTQGARARFLEPDHLLSVLAHLVKGRGTVLGREAIEELRKIRTSSMGAGNWAVQATRT